MRKENKYAIAFDANKDFREIRIMDDPNEPFTIGQDMRGGSIYVFTQKEFKKLIESAMMHLTDVTDQVTCKEESAALEVLVSSLFEYGDVLFDPDGPHGPSLIINNEPSTEISLTKKQAEALLNVGVPCFADMEEN